MKMYTFEDLLQHHHVNELADRYRQRGRDVSHIGGWTPEAWWDKHYPGEITRPLDFYKCDDDFLGCSLGVERFAWMYFKEGWLNSRKQVQS